MNRLVAASTFGLVALAFALPADAYVIVRKDGSRFEAKSPPEYKDGKAIFTLPGGSSGSMPESSIDKAATDKANAAAKKEEAKTFTNESLSSEKSESLGSQNPGGLTKSTFTNDDLSKAEGTAVVEGEVEVGTAAESEDDWAKRHDEEMARLYGDKSGEGSGAEAAGGGAEAAASERATAEARGATEAAPSEPPADESDEAKVARLEKEVQALRDKLASIDRQISGGAGDATTVNQRLQTASDLTAKEQELAEARGN